MKQMHSIDLFFEGDDNPHGVVWCNGLDVLLDQSVIVQMKDEFGWPQVAGVLRAHDSKTMTLDVRWGSITVELLSIARLGLVP